jgi:hypothetical protein
VLVHSGHRRAAAGPVLAIPFWGQLMLFFKGFFLCSFSGNSFPPEDLKKIGDLPQESFAFYLAVNHIYEAQIYK